MEYMDPTVLLVIVIIVLVVSTILALVVVYQLYTACCAVQVVDVYDCRTNETQRIPMRMYHNVYRAFQVNPTDAEYAIYIQDPEKQMEFVRLNPHTRFAHLPNTHFGIEPIQDMRQRHYNREDARPPLPEGVPPCSPV